MTDAPEDLKALVKRFPEKLVISKDVNRTRSVINRRIFGCADGEDDIIVFYFAGHGDAKPVPVLIGADFEAKHAAETTLPLSYVLGWASQRREVECFF